MTAIVFTEHARMRYRRRIPASQRVDVQIVAAEGVIRDRAPMFALTGATATGDAFLVHGEAVFPLLRDEDDVLVAVTCLRRRRRSKADIRAFREQTRDFMETA